MKLETAPVIQLMDSLNPRGNLAKELEMTAKKASWLSLLCSYWLAYHKDNAEDARSEQPTYRLPSSFKESVRYNLAFVKCGLWEPMAPTKRDGHRPTWGSRSDWVWIWDYYYSGGLDRGIEYLKSVLPEANVEAIDKELLK